MFKVCVNGTTSQGLLNIVGRGASSLISMLAIHQRVAVHIEKRDNTCFECCATDTCNEQLCSHLQRKFPNLISSY